LLTLKGLVIESGAGATNIVAIENGKTNFEASQRAEFGGNDITKYLTHLLSLRGHNFTTSSEIEVVKSIKHDFAFVSRVLLFANDNSN
jgi:actin-related protein